jgi:hypothetical protein
MRGVQARPPCCSTVDTIEGEWAEREWLKVLYKQGEIGFRDLEMEEILLASESDILI